MAVPLGPFYHFEFSGTNLMAIYRVMQLNLDKIKSSRDQKVEQVA